MNFFCRGRLFSSTLHKVLVFRNKQKNLLYYRYVSNATCRISVVVNDFQRLNLKSLSNNSSCHNKSDLSELDYERIAETCLESLSEAFERFADSSPPSAAIDFDISYAMGVLTVKLGDGKGTFVINKQTPNKQIWFSSPISGPYRFDYVDGKWIYLRTGQNMHDLLNQEFKGLFPDAKFDFTKCSHS